MGNLISTAISDAQIAAIDTSLAALETNLPTVPSISDKEKKAKQQLGPNGVSYVNKAASMAATHFNVMPKSLELEEVNKDLKLFNQLNVVEIKVLKLLSIIQNMRQLAGIDMMEHSNSIYKALQDAAKKDASLMAAVAELGEFYAKRNTKAKTSNP
jgi:hypothetical protein